MRTQLQPDTSATIENGDDNKKKGLEIDLMRRASEVL